MHLFRIQKYSTARACVQSSGKVQTGPGAHPASYSIDNEILSAGKTAGAWNLPLISI